MSLELQGKGREEAHHGSACASLYELHLQRSLKWRSTTTTTTTTMARSKKALRLWLVVVRPGPRPPSTGVSLAQQAWTRG